MWYCPKKCDNGISAIFWKTHNISITMYCQTIFSWLVWAEGGSKWKLLIMKEMWIIILASIKVFVSNIDESRVQAKLINVMINIVIHHRMFCSGLALHTLDDPPFFCVLDIKSRSVIFSISKKIVLFVGLAKLHSGANTPPSVMVLSYLYNCNFWSNADF